MEINKKSEQQSTIIHNFLNFDNSKKHKNKKTNVFKGNFLPFIRNYDE